MDLNQLLSLFRASWDLPWRVLASLLAIVTAVSFWVGSRPLGVVANLVDWSGAPHSFASTIVGVDGWISARAVIIGPLGFVLLLLAFIWAGERSALSNSNRAPATALIGAATAVQADWGAGVTALTAAVVIIWLAAVVARVVSVARARGRYLPSGVFSVEERLRRTWLAPLVAAVYVPFAPLTWMIR